MDYLLERGHIPSSIPELKLNQDIDTEINIFGKEYKVSGCFVFDINQIENRPFI